MVQAMIEGGAIATQPRLAIVLTKFDLVLESNDRQRAETDFASLVADLGRLFADAFSTVQSFRVAASPKSDVIARGAGVPELFTFWLGAAPIVATVRPAAPGSERVFGRLSAVLPA